MRIIYPIVRLSSDARYIVEAQLVSENGSAPMTFMHIEVFHWNKTTLKDLKDFWRVMRPLLPPILFAQGMVDDAKWDKFTRHFGFEPLSSVLCNDGQERRIHVNLSQRDQ